MYGTVVASIFLLPIAGFSQTAQEPQAPASQASSPTSGAQSTTPAAAAPDAQAPANSGSQSSPPSLKLEPLPNGPGTTSGQPGANGQQAAQPSQQDNIALQIRTLAMQQARWGAAISTPGLSLEIREVGRNKTPEGMAITYQLHTIGFTNDLPLSVLRWPLNGQLTPVAEGVAIDASGLVICPTTPPAATPPAPAATTGGAGTPGTAGTPEATARNCASAKPGQPISVTLTAAKGEAERIAVVASDHKHGAASEVAPFPIVAEDKGCKLEILLGTKNAELILIRGEGFQPSIPVALQSDSFGEKHVINGKTDPKGNFVLGTLPFVVGNDAGDTKLSYSSPECSPAVTFHWGKNTYHVEQ